MSGTKSQIQEAPRTPSRINAKKQNKAKQNEKNPTPRYIIFKLKEIQDKKSCKKQRG